MKSFDLHKILSANGYTIGDILVTQLGRLQHCTLVAAFLHNHFGVSITQQAVHRNVIVRGMKKVFLLPEDARAMCELYGAQLKPVSRRALEKGLPPDYPQLKELQDAIVSLQSQNGAWEKVTELWKAEGRDLSIHRTLCARYMGVIAYWLDYGYRLHFQEKYGYEMSAHSWRIDPVIWDARRHNPALWAKRLGYEKELQ